jgi:integrase
VDPSRAGAEKTKGDYDKQIHGFIEFVDVELNGPLKGKKAKPAESREPVRVKHIERDRVSRWVRHLETEGSHRYASRDKLSPRTARHHRASLSALCGWLMEKGYLTDNPVSRAYKPRLAKTDPVYMTREQWALFRAESEAHDAERTMEKAEPDTTFWKFLAATGATTYNEGCAVRPTDIHVRQNPGSPMVRVWLGGTKSDNRPRSVWIARALAEEVLAYGKRWGRSPHEPVFQFERSDGYYRFKKIVKRLANAGHEGFDVMNPYTLRHTYAVAMIQGDPERGIPGVDIVTLARLMGHGDNITTTMIYARHVGDYAAMGCQNMATAMGLDR